MGFAIVLAIIVVILVIQIVQYSSRHNSDTTKIEILELEKAELKNKIADLKTDTEVYLDLYMKAVSERDQSIKLTEDALRNSQDFFEVSAERTADTISCFESIKEIACSLNIEDVARIISLCDDEIKKSQDFLDVVEELIDFPIDEEDDD